MSTTIQIKRSSTASAIPVTGDIAVGELAVNLADKRLFTKQSDGTIIELSTNPTDLDAATLRIDGVEITASATELNSLDGFTGSVAELNLLDGLTATTIELNTLDGITASTAELNKLDGYTGSTAELNILDGVTATTAEINTLDGITASTAELNITDGLTATTAELNTLDGITATTTELNYTDGVTSNIQTQLDAMVEKSGDTMTGDLSLGDNVKAKFGAGNDLQIYHDGSNSYVSDVGTGKLFLKSNGTATVILDEVGGPLAEFHTPTKEARLYQAGSLKLATKATGVDVTGTVTADGLTVGNAGATTDIILTEGSTNTDARIRNTNGILEIDADINNEFGASSIVFGVDGVDKLKIDRTGDVSFFEDTGTTAKMVWDSSAEKLRLSGANNHSAVLSENTLSFDRGAANYIMATNASGWLEFYAGNNRAMVVKADGKVGIGADNPTALLDVVGGRLYVDSADNYAIRVEKNSDVGGYIGAPSVGNMAFYSSGGSETARIDFSGNVGIGTSSPARQLHIQSNGPDAYLKLNSTGNNSSALLELSNDATTWTAGVNSVDTFVINNGGAERARIDSSGNLLVGTTANVGQAGKFLADGGSAVKGIAAVTETICSGASGTFGTITISFSGNHSSSTGIMDVQVAGYNVKAVDYCIMQYSSFPTNTLRSNVSSGLTVAITGNPSDGGAWTMTITGGVTHPVVTAKCTAGGLATGFSSAPTISFS